ncbi:MAG: DUF3846 domain-containing protein [Oscillospiraceae bacterium]
MKVVLLEPEKVSQIIEIENNLKSMQKVVGGLIEAVYPWEEKVCLVCNDEGKLESLPLNRYVAEMGDAIAGSCFICGLGEEDFCSLTDEQAARYAEKFRLPHEFIQTPHGILVHEYEPRTEPVQNKKTTKKRSEPAR